MKSIIRLSFVITLFAIYACENDLAKINAISAKLAETPVDKSKDVEMIYSDSAKVKARLLTPLLLQYHTKSPYDEMPKGLKVEFFNPLTTNVESVLTAKYGVRRQIDNNPMKHKIEVRDSVVVVNNSGKKLETEHLVWDEDRRIVFSDKFVKITSKDKIIQGYGFESDEALSNPKFKRVSGEIYLDKPVGAQ